MRFSAAFFLRLVVLCFVGVLVLSSIRCDTSPKRSAVVEKQATEKTASESESMLTFDPKVSVTVGNHSYVYVNKEVDSGDQPEMILNLLDSFEKAHPELTITSWAIENRHNSYITNAYIYGLWINHKPK